MGGNALKHLGVRRVGSEEAWAMFWRVQHIANVYGLRAVLVPWVSEKKDHGDIDILIGYPPDDARGDDLGRIARDIAEALHVEPAHRIANGTVTSCGVPMPSGGLVQVDLIMCPERDLPHFMLYYSGSGLGMLLGRVASWHGLVFAQEGLRLRANPDLPWCRDVLLSSCPFYTLRALGYEPDAGGGFATEEQVWRYVFTSEWAEPHMFLPEATNAENRSRDKGRPSWGRFVDWLNKENPPALHRRYPAPANWEEAVQNAVGLAEEVISPAHDVRAELIRQERQWNFARLRHYELGMGAVRHHRPNITPEVAGTVIRRVHELLPEKTIRDGLYAGGLGNQVEQLARAAALIAITEQGIPP